MFLINIFYASKLVHLITAKLRQLYKLSVNSTWLSLLSYVFVLIITSLFLRFKRVITHFKNRLTWVKRDQASTVKIWTPGKGRLFRVVWYSYLMNIFDKHLNIRVMLYPWSINSKLRLENRSYSETVWLDTIS